MNKARKPPVSVSRERTVIAAVRLTAEQRVGVALVLDDGRPAGIFTERDLMTKVLLHSRDPGRTSIGEVMSARQSPQQAATLINIPAAREMEGSGWPRRHRALRSPRSRLPQASTCGRILKVRGSFRKPVHERRGPALGWPHDPATNRRRRARRGPAPETSTRSAVSGIVKTDHDVLPHDPATGWPHRVANWQCGRLLVGCRRRTSPRRITSCSPVPCEAAR